MRQRLDKAVVQRALLATRSQAESYIRLGKVTVNKKVVTKPGLLVGERDGIELLASEQYVSRAALKLASVAETLALDFRGKVMLDVGSSTGGFTDYALQHGARKVIAVDAGTGQLHPSLRGDERIELHEKTDIRSLKSLSTRPDLVVVDVSFISLRNILPAVVRLSGRGALTVAMAKPQFEAGDRLKHKGVIKNDAIRRQILHDFEVWAKKLFAIVAKADSDVSGARGNRERFYALRPL